jgi:hypothetical protein
MECFDAVRALFKLGLDTPSPAAFSQSPIVFAGAELGTQARGSAFLQHHNGHTDGDHKRHTNKDDRPLHIT